MLKHFTRRKVAGVALSAGLVAGAAGCWNTNIILDHAWFDQPTAGPGGTSLTSIHSYDSDSSHTESCNYPADFGCQPGGVRVVYDAVGPNGENERKGREGPWVTLTSDPGNQPCSTNDANGQPGYGYPGYGGFTPPTDACVAWFQAEITDDPADTNPDEKMWNICNYPPTSGSPPTTASGANPRDCQNGGSGTKATGGGPTNVNTWARAQFVGGNPSQGWTNVKDLIYVVRDYYLTQITDPQIQPSTNPQRNGYASCFSIYDYTPAGGSSRVRLQRLCP